MFREWEGIVKFLLVFLCIILFMVACSSSPDESSVQTAVAETLSVEIANLTIKDTSIDSEPPPTLTLSPTNTQQPTPTPKPTSKPTETPVALTREDVHAEFTKIIIETLEDIDDIELINLVRFDENGILEIEFSTIWASDDSQPDASYLAIKFLAALFSMIDQEDARKLTGGPGLSIHIVTYSSNGNYRYESLTPFDVLQQIEQKKISYDEWVKAANAGFR